MDKGSTASKEFGETASFLSSHSDESSLSEKTEVVVEAVAQESGLQTLLLPATAAVLFASVAVLIYFAVRFDKPTAEPTAAEPTTAVPTGNSYCYARTLPPQSVPSAEYELKHSFIEVRLRHQTELIESETRKRVDLPPDKFDERFVSRKWQFLVTGSINSPLLTSFVIQCTAGNQWIYRFFWDPIPHSDRANWVATTVSLPQASSFDRTSLTPFLDDLWDRNAFPAAEDTVSRKRGEIAKGIALNMEHTFWLGTSSSSNKIAFVSYLQPQPVEGERNYSLDWQACVIGYDEDITIRVFLSNEPDATAELQCNIYCDFGIWYAR